MVVLLYNPSTMEAELELQVRGQAGQDYTARSSKQNNTPVAPQKPQAYETYLDIDVASGVFISPVFAEPGGPTICFPTCRTSLLLAYSPYLHAHRAFRLCQLVFLTFHCSTHHRFSF